VIVRSIRRDSGNALIEVVILTPLLLVPLVWLAVSVALVTSAQGTVTSAARQAARAYVLATNVPSANRSARRIAASIVGTDSRGLARPTVAITCVPVACLTANGRVDVSVTTQMALNFLPVPFTRGPTVTLHATGSALVDPFRP
jgi:Flp pilus assembly protein TadG